jgi:hypothetical protein
VGFPLGLINASTDGLSRKQMSALFHGHLCSSRIEAALEQLTSLGAIYPRSRPSGGRPSTLWSAIPETESSDKEAIVDESTAEETTNEESMQEQGR